MMKWRIAQYVLVLVVLPRTEEIDYAIDTYTKIYWSFT